MASNQSLQHDVLSFAKLCMIYFTVYSKYYYGRFRRYITTRYFASSLPIVPTRTSHYITRVLAFCEDSPDDDGIPDFTDFADITHWFEEAGDNWMDEMSIIFANWRTWKIEIRYVTRGGDKKRLVTRHNEDLIWPPLPAQPSPTILVALLCSSLKDVDITARVKKYVVTGSNVLRASDLFPMDDHEYNADYHTGIRIISMTADGKVVDSFYTYDDVLFASK